MAIDIGLWRSTLGDTHPHVGVDVAWDYWPQATHLAWEAPCLVGCFTGGGGGSQRAMFKSDLDPILGGARDRWLQAPTTGDPQLALDRFFEEIQRGFDTRTEPAWADEFAATGVAVLIAEHRAALANIGLARAYAWTNGELAQLTTDDSLAKRHAAQQHPEWFRHTAASGFRKAPPERAGDNTWTTYPIAPGGVLLLASGLVEAGIDNAYLTGAMRAVHEDPVPLAGAQDLVDRLGTILVKFGANTPPEDRIEWKLHSRLALAVIWPD